MKRKVSVIIVAVFLAFSLLSCKSNIEKTESVTTNDSSETTTSIESDSSDIAKVASESFVLESGKYKLNAIYTYLDDGEKHPSVLLIAGSGPSDCDETVGAWKPFRDIAELLAKKGINSMRVDKRTFNYAMQWEETYGIEEEYLIDCRVALDDLKAHPQTGDIYLLGHSLGGQIATVIANEDEDISGLILFNSSARNLAEIACDQYAKLDPAKKNAYISYRDSAMASTSSNAKGYYYFGATDHYWATLNQVNVIENIKMSGLPALIINSTYDVQTFEDDLNLWKSGFDNDENVKLIVDDKINHFGYEADTTDNDVFLSSLEFPDRIITYFTDFIEYNRKTSTNT